VKNASEYATKLTIQGLTIAAIPFNDPALCREAFGAKQDPLKYGILPVLVVIQNTTKQAVSLHEARVELSREDLRMDPVPPEELAYSRGVRKVPGTPSRNPLPFPIPSKNKNPLADPVYGVRAFSAKIIPPGANIGGFVYFLTPWRAGFTLLLRGLTEQTTGKELFFYEIPLESPQ